MSSDGSSSTATKISSRSSTPADADRGDAEGGEHASKGGIIASDARQEVTALLAQWRVGDARALEQLMPLVYAELHRIAEHAFRTERVSHTLQSTALVHEAFLRLLGQDVEWQNRAHFFGIASQLMRRVLVDHARARSAAKRGHGKVITLVEGMDAGDGGLDVDLLALDDALTRLGTMDERQARIVELRFFGGLTIDETAEVISASPATVKREWTTARAWLYSQLA